MLAELHVVTSGKEALLLMVLVWTVIILLTWIPWDDSRYEVRGLLQLQSALP